MFDLKNIDYFTLRKNEFKVALLFSTLQKYLHQIEKFKKKNTNPILDLHCV